MSRKSIIDSDLAIAERLRDLSEGKSVSRYLIDKLVKIGYVTMIESRKPGQRGQTTKAFEVSEKGKELISSMKNVSE